MGFKESLEIGKEYELFAENYFKKNNLNYIDVRNKKEYQIIDVDYLVNNKKYEVKKNLNDAKYGHKGLYFNIELSIDERQGWWYFNDTDFFFFANDNQGIILKNDDNFKNIINNMIKDGDHSKSGKNRFDFIYDKRYNGFVKVVCMRVYLEDLSDIDIKRVVKRVKI